jgi:hypothetical protein
LAIDSKKAPFGAFFVAVTQSSLHPSLAAGYPKSMTTFTDTGLTTDSGRRLTHDEEQAIAWHADSVAYQARRKSGMDPSQVDKVWINAIEDLLADTELLAKMVQAHQRHKRGHKVSSMAVVLEHDGVIVSAETDSHDNGHSMIPELQGGNHDRRSNRMLGAFAVGTTVLIGIAAYSTIYSPPVAAAIQTSNRREHPEPPQKRVELIKRRGKRTEEGADNPDPDRTPALR